MTPNKVSETSEIPGFSLDEGFRFGDWNVFPSENTLQRGDEHIRLEPKVMQLLLALIANHGKPCTRDRLMNRLWPSLEAGEASLTRAVSALRKSLGDQRNPAQYIDTIQRIGYKAVAPVRPLSASLTDPVHYARGRALDTAEEITLLAEYLIARGNGPDLLRAAALLSGFVEREPHHATALALLAYVQQIIHLYCDEPPALRITQSRANAERALKLDAANGLAWAMLGRTARTRWQWAEAIGHFERALRFAPHNPHVMHGYALMLQELGQTEVAQTMVRNVCRLQPLDGNARILLAWNLMHYGTEGVEEELSKARQLGANSVFSDNAECLLFHRAGWDDVSIRKWHKIHQQQRHNALWLWPRYMLEALAGNQAHSRMIQTVRCHVNSGDLSPGIAMFMLATVNALDAAFEMAYQAIGSKSFFILDPWLKELDAFRNDPRFNELRPLLGLNDPNLHLSAA